jgi:hypothetical protein
MRVEYRSFWPSESSFQLPCLCVLGDLHIVAVASYALPQSPFLPPLEIVELEPSLYSDADMERVPIITRVSESSAVVASNVLDKRVGSWPYFTFYTTKRARISKLPKTAKNALLLTSILELRFVPQGIRACLSFAY